MGASLHVSLETVADDDLYTLFGLAEEGGDLEGGKAIQAEIIRRCDHSPTTVHDLPAWLARLLPSAMWHQKPGGGGE